VGQASLGHAERGPGRFGPRTKDSFEYVYHFARGLRPHFDLDAVRVPSKAQAAPHHHPPKQQEIPS
jgi:hypothetical protein